MLFHLAGRHHFLAVQALGNVAQQDIGTQHHQATQRRFQQQPEAAQHADRGRAPQRGGGVQPTYVEPVAHDHAATKKTDARYHVRGDTRRIGGRHARYRLGHQHEQAGTGADQCIGAQPGQALAQLTFGADQRPQQQGDADTQQKYFPIHSKPLPRAHARTNAISWRG
ncbi:hypothetical protein D3C75_734540 [compost metagenome]